MNPFSEARAALFPGVTQTLRVAPITLEHKLLLWLLRYPFQRSEDLSLALSRSGSTIYRHLAQFEAGGLVEYITPPLASGNPTHCYYLTHKGLLAAAGQEQAEPAALAHRWQADERGLLRLLPRIHQILNLQNVVNSLVAHAPSALASRGGHPASLYWHWRRDYSHQFRSHREIIRCRADATLVLQRQPSPAFPVQDPSCMSMLLLAEGVIEADAQLIRQRLDALLRYRESRERTPYYQHFPPLLIVVTSEHQRTLWQRCAQEVALVRRVRPLHGAIVVLAPLGSMASAWSLPWQNLAERGPCHLQDLLVPLPPEALLAGMMPPAPTETRSSAPQTPRLVRGRFSERAQHLALQRDGNPAHEREAVALLSLRLSLRHLALLRQLWTFPLLATADLAALSGADEETIRRYLATLHITGCLSRIATPEGPRWLLRERGLRYVAALQQVTMQRVTERNPEQRTPGALARVQRGVLMLRRHLRHTAGIYRFLRQLYQAAAMHEQHRALWFESGRHSERSYRRHGVWHNFRPDAAFAYQAGEQRLVAWLEWDEGSMSLRNLAAKLYEYQRVVRGREWVRYDTRTVPLLLFVVPDSGQERRVVQIVRRILTNTGLTVRSTTANRLATYGPLAPIWFQALPTLPNGMPRQPLFPTRTEAQ
jgi:hypothetical protein